METAKNTAKICVPVRASSLDALLQKIQTAQAEADIVELWLGDLPNEERGLEKIFTIKQKPYLLTVKTSEENGNFSGTPTEKLEILLQGARLGAEYCDLSHEFPLDLIEQFIAEKGKTELILSAHFFDHTPSVHDLSNLAQKMQFLGADIIKIATFAQSYHDLVTMLELAERCAHAEIRFIIIAMGEYGKISRIATPLMGGEMMFTCLNEEEKTADGQMTVQATRNLLNKLDCS